MENADFSAQTLDVGIEELDQNEIERFKDLIKDKEPGSALLTLPLEEMLTALGILKKTANSVRTTIAGLILLGKETSIQTILPSAELIYLHMTNETEYDKRINCTQPLLVLFDKISSEIQQRNRSFSLKIGLFDYAIPNFPEVVIREALLNALIHRDYRLLSPIYVRHYPDFLEIASPGNFLGGITPENILTHEPIIRNPLLMTILAKLGVVEKAGMGMKRIFTGLLSLGKEPPHFEVKEPFVRMIIHDGNVDELFATLIIRRAKEGKELNLTELLVLSYLKRNREIEIKTASHLLQRPEYKTKEILNALIERGILEPFGQTKGTVYRLSKEVFTKVRRSIEYRLHRRAEAAYAENVILEYVKENGYITNEVCRTLLRINRSQALYLLNRLVGKNKLTKPAKGRNARYLRRHT